MYVLGSNSSVNKRADDKTNLIKRSKWTNTTYNNTRNI